MMRLPIRQIAGQLVFTTTGAVWSVWKVEPVTYAHASRSAKLALLDDTEALLKSLTGEWVLSSVCPVTDPVDVVDRMISGVDLDAAPQYAAACDTTMDLLERMDLRHRVRFLAVPLPGGTGRAAAGAFGAAAGQIQTALGLPAPRIGAAEIAARAAQAAEMRGSWAGRLKITPASPGEILWLYARASRRGLAEPAMPGDGDGAFGLAALSEVLFDEGAKTDRTAGQRRTRPPGDPFGARILKVLSEFGASYQAFLALAEMPASFRFPGAEWMAAIDGFDFPVDWSIVGRCVPRAEAEAKSRRQARELNAQTGEYTGGDAGGAPPHALLEAQDALDEYRSRLAASASEVEIQATTVLGVYADTPAEAGRRAEIVRMALATNDYQLVRPTGAQTACYAAFLPGTVPAKALGDYTQFLLARDFAMAMPLAGTEIGDAAGGLFGLSLTGSGAVPVLIDFTRGPRIDASGSAAFVGELGSGKSVAMKTAAWHTLARHRPSRPGGARSRVLAVDRTPSMEWVRFLSACPGQTQVIRVSADAGVSLDPLRIFAGAAAVRHTQAFLDTLLAIPTMSDEGTTLAEAIETVARSPQPSLTALAQLLAAYAERGDQFAASLARKLRVVGSKPDSRALFDLALPPLTVSDADSIVFAVSELALPRLEELASEHAAARLPFSKLFGQAVLVLLAAVCREVAFAQQHEFVLVEWDECWWMAGSPAGRQLMLELVRDGRKHFAAIHFGMHDPQDLGALGDEAGDTLRGLLGLLFAFRHTNPRLAARALEFLGLDKKDADLLELVTAGLSPKGVPEAERQARAGECLFRDLSGRLGMLKVLIPLDADAAEAIHTTPGDAAAVPV